MRYYTTDDHEQPLYQIQYIGNGTFLGKTLCYQPGYMHQFLTMIKTALDVNLPPNSKCYFIYDHSETQNSFEIISPEDMNVLLTERRILSNYYPRTEVVYIAPNAARVFSEPQKTIMGMFGSKTYHVDTFQEALTLIYNLENSMK